MQRRKFSREFKRLARERGVTVAQAARDLDVHQNVLRKWVRDFGADTHLENSCQPEMPIPFWLVCG